MPIRIEGVELLEFTTGFTGSHVNKTYYERESNNELISEQMILQIIRQKPNYSGFYFDKSANRYSHAILSLSYKASFPV